MAAFAYELLSAVLMACPTVTASVKFAIAESSMAGTVSSAPGVCAPLATVPWQKLSAIDSKE